MSKSTRSPFKGARRIEGLVQSDIRAMTAECQKANGINLGQGLCETETPAVVLSTAAEAIGQKTKNLYSAPEGILPLRQKIAAKLKSENNIEADPHHEIIVTNGATGGYAATLMALLNPGDGILFFEPYYGYHVNAALLAELKPQFVPFTDGDMGITEAAVRTQITADTKAIMICTPANPSGKMWSAEEIAVIEKLAVEFDLLVITDEMYEYFRYDGRSHLSPASQGSLWSRTVTMMGLSKTFSITGWRLGYVTAPKPLAEKIRLANDLFYVCAPTPLQHGVAAGFDLPPAHYENLQKEFQAKRNQLCEAFEIAGLRPLVPQGAYYILADISAFTTTDSKKFAMDFLAATGVATIPGRAFFHSDAGHRYVRANFAVKTETLNTACERIRAFKGL